MLPCLNIELLDAMRLGKPDWREFYPKALPARSSECAATALLRIEAVEQIGLAHHKQTAAIIHGEPFGLGYGALESGEARA